MEKPSNDVAPPNDPLLLLQSARRAYEKNKTYELALEVQVAEADYNRLAQENRRAITLIWVNPEEPLPAFAKSRFWKLYFGKKDYVHERSGIGQLGMEFAAG